MKRIHFIEFEDLAWFPGWLRECMTRYLTAFHRMVGTAQVLPALLARAGRAGRTTQLLALCPGGTGPGVATLRELQKLPDMAQARVTFTDLYPNAIAARAVQNLADPELSYRMEPVDATRVPAELKGVRTMICSLHHMRPELARKILEDAWKTKTAFCAYEVSDNGPPLFLSPLAFPFGFLLTLLLVPFVRPWDWKMWFFTYVIPLLPFFIAWDGTVSNMRTYTMNDMRELTAPFQSADYAWEMGRVKTRGGPALYLLGLPQR